jgi:hypothetical protein
MLDTILGALLPLVVTFLLGFVAAWRRDFGRGATQKSQGIGGIWADSIYGLDWLPTRDFVRHPVPGTRASSELDAVASQAVQWVPGTDAGSPGVNASNGNLVYWIFPPVSGPIANPDRYFRIRAKLQPNAAATPPGSN